MAEAIGDAIDERAVVVMLPAAHWTDGAAVDLDAVAPLVREAGAALVVDLPAPAQRRVAAALAEAGVFVGVRGPAVRVSPHLWTTEEGIGRLVGALATALSG